MNSVVYVCANVHTMSYEAKMILVAGGCGVGGGAQACVTLNVSHSVYALKQVQTTGTRYMELS